MQKNDTHIQNLINKAKQEEPVVPKEFARTLLEKQALRASAMSHINKGTKMLNTISIASMAVATVMLMNIITTSNINKNEVSKIKEQNPKEQIIVQKNDVAQANNVKSDEVNVESVSIQSDDNSDNCHITTYQIMSGNKIAPTKQAIADKQTTPIKQVPTENNTISTSNQSNTEQVSQNSNNPIDIAGINPIRLTKEEIAKLGFTIEKGGSLSYYNCDGIDNKHIIKYSILYPWGFEYSDESQNSIVNQNLINPKFRLISNQNGEKRVSVFTENLGDNNNGEALGKFSRTVQYNDKNKEELSIYKFNFDNLPSAKINTLCLADSNLKHYTSSNIGITLQPNEQNNQGFDIIMDTSNNLMSTNISQKVYIKSFSNNELGLDTNNIKLLFEKLELNNDLIHLDTTTNIDIKLNQLQLNEGSIQIDTVSNIDFTFKQFELNNDINLNELLPIEVEMIDDNGEALIANGKLQTLIIWFEPTLEFIEKLPEQIKRKLSPELEAMPNDYETCPTPPVTGGQPHFDVWRACSGAVENLKTYPTPVEDVLHFKYTLAEDRQISMYVCNLNGEVIANPIKYENYRKGCVEDQINVGYLNSGMYLLVISSDAGEKAVQRFLVK